MPARPRAGILRTCSPGQEQRPRVTGRSRNFRARGRPRRRCKPPRRPPAALRQRPWGRRYTCFPRNSRRLRHLAVDLGTSLHDLVLAGLDKVLAENGQPPLRRYGAAKKEKKR